jgi:hypothetical protein
MNAKILRLTVCAFLLLAYGFCDKPYLFSQDTANSGTKWDSAANRWQLKAVDLQSQVDTVSQATRDQRNAHWRVPLESAYNASKGAAGTVTVGNGFILDALELPNVKGAIWVLATFKTFHVFAIDPDFHLIYTEMNFQVDKVISQPDDSNLSIGSAVDLGTPGGRVKTPDGTFVASRIDPIDYFFRTYEEQLGGEFVTHRWWDITSGTVQPDTPEQIARAKRGDSAIIGMTVHDLVSYLTKNLPSAGKE